MTERRRFFPSKTVQQVPGQKVEVEVELKKGGEAPAAPPCAPTCFFWGSRRALVKTERDTEGGKEIRFDEWDPDLSLTSDRYDDEGNWFQYFEQGTAWLRSEWHQDYITHVSENRKESIIQTASVLAIPVGPSCGLTWALSWEGGYKPNRHIEFSADGPVAIIHVRTIDGVEELNQGVAVLTASCAGKAVGTLRLVVLPDELVIPPLE